VGEVCVQARFWRVGQGQKRRGNGAVPEAAAGGRMKRRIGDRRSKPRFEIVGDLWGSIDATASMLVQNLGRGGALLDSPLPLAPDSVHWVTAMADNQPHLVQIRVCHSRAIVTPAGRSRFLIGVEFLKLSPGVEEAIVRYMELADGSVSAEV
jgi:hypothetical protein